MRKFGIFYRMKEETVCGEIFHLATPIQLNLETTLVYLGDYFLHPEKITNIDPVDGLKMELNQTNNTLLINVSGFIPHIFLINIYINQELYNLVLLRSQKLIYKYTFDSHGGYIQSLQIAGDFNNWNPSDNYFNYTNGKWEIDLKLEPGNYPYQLIANGNWFNDPDNPNKIDNGYGGFNSLLKVRTEKQGEVPRITTEKDFSLGCVLSSDEKITDFVVLWQNKRINSASLFRNNEKLLITIPKEAYNIKRSFLRVWAYNDFGLSNDLLIPLEYGKVLTDAKQLSRNDKENQIIYFLMVDRFCNGNPSNDNPIKAEGLQTKLNYYGGDIAGITQKIKEKYFNKLGVNTLWISPVVKNPDHACESDGQKSTGYHGYWPTISTRIDEHFGTVEDLKEMVNEAHKNNINVILDLVANHVHEDNFIIKMNPDWATPLYLPDGSLNIGRWEEHRLTTWFDKFLPTLDYEKPEVVDTMTEFALYWVDAYNLDGFRHDATKHIPDVFWRKLTHKLKHAIMCRENKRLYQIGETFGGRDLLKSYVNSGMLDGQFSFNLYYEVRSAFCFDHEPFDKLSIALEQDLQAFGYNNKMGNISGNHRFTPFYFICRRRFKYLSKC
ncbi:MAG: alpha-amylase [Bacteroidales bacterium]|nr:alpha-amylase [Bacteroidales bacterium]